MIIVFKKKATKSELERVSEDLNGYIKFVVDVEKGILTAGGKMHVEGEQVLLKDGSSQANLWGGGYDLESGEVDFDSMINIRPNQGNNSREVLDAGIREDILKIVQDLLIQ